jgi:hypothetical protein
MIILPDADVTTGSVLSGFLLFQPIEKKDRLSKKYFPDKKKPEWWKNSQTIFGFCSLNISLLPQGSVFGACLATFPVV